MLGLSKHEDEERLDRVKTLSHSLPPCGGGSGWGDLRTDSLPNDPPPKSSPTRGEDFAKRKTDYASTRAILRIFVEPGVPKGKPAVMTMRSPFAAKPSRTAWWLAFSTMSRKSRASSV
jgi:hypothetical protein